MLDVLDVTNDTQRQYGDYVRPESEVSGPYISVVFDLEGCLQRERNDEAGDNSLQEHTPVSHNVPS